MRNALLFILGLLLLVTTPASAGPLYGTVRIGQAPAAAVTIQLACPGFAPDTPVISATTDAQGSYSLLVRASGHCEMRVQRGSQVGVAFEVGVSDNPLRFDFNIDGAMNRVN